MNIEFRSEEIGNLKLEIRNTKQEKGEGIEYRSKG
jgi:hypothetical protein